MTPMLQNLQQVWKGMGLIQRVILLGVLLACIGAMALLVGWARQPEMTLLYSDLSPDEAAEIVENISDEGVEHELRSGGTSIYVPKEHVYDLRLKMASAGLPQGSHAGYQILDEEKIGASPFSQRVNYTRAIEGELAKTIELIDGVSSARVHVVQPEAPVFAGEKRQPSATVAVRLHPGRRLSSGNVAAIVHLVAGSVEGLTPSKVVVVDAGGNLLTSENESELARSADTLLDYRTQVEQYLSNKAEEMLTAVLGPNRASVRVSATINTRSLSETVETYDPDGKVITKETIESTQSSSPDGGGGGNAGNSKEENIITEFRVGRTLRQQQELPGDIESLSVAAFVDLSGPQAEGAGEEGAAAASAAPSMTVEDAEEIIRNALGLEADAPVKVVNMPFHSHQQAEMAPPEPDGGILPLILEIARRSSLGILVIGALVALRMFTGKSKARTAALEAANSEQNYLPSDGEDDSEQLRRRITRALQDNPEEVKRLFLSWVKTEEGG
ncbi:MAG: flagellar basal-body MS-ring/collar protein FliF [Phycisphaerae bacterium]